MVREVRADAGVAPAPARATLEEVKAAVEFCKAHGITRLKTGTLELDISPMGGPASDEERMKVAQALGEQLSDEDLLFFSAPQSFVPAPAQADEG